MTEKTCTAIIVAAGTASRMKGIDKTVTPIDGVPLIKRTVEAIARGKRVTDILIVTREDLIPVVSKLCKEEPKLTAVIPGGSTRSESVLRGLQAATGELVAIHDGARPFATGEMIDTVIDKGETFGAAAPAIPLKDTVKVARDSRVISTPDRATLFAVQTPQVFYRHSILQALTRAVERGIALTDDCSAAEAAGIPVALTEGSEENIQITTPMDLILGEAILKRRSES